MEVGVGSATTGVATGAGVFAGVAAGSDVWCGVTFWAGDVRGAASRARFFSTAAEGAGAGWAAIGVAIGGGAGVAAAIGGGAGATGRGRSAAFSCSAADCVRAYPAV